tara:strand:+ start:140 stop:967 length:828 start_codon:yes stop_codon:yes gene_type:complete
MHVALTGFFFVDNEYRNFMAGRPMYFFGLPLLLIVGSGSITHFLGASGEAYIFIGYHGWLLWHYGRQNIGVLSFVSSSAGGESVTANERRILNGAALGGLLGAYGVISQFDKTAFAPYEQNIIQIGAFIYTIAICGALANFVSLVRIKQPISRCLFSLLLPLFFAPTFFFDDYLRATMSYAIAHACQYFVFMYYLASGDSKKGQTNVLLLASVAVLGWILIWLTRDSSLWGQLSGFMPGVALALIMWHFIIDAGVWQLRDPWQRNQIRKRFTFLT